LWAIQVLKEQRELLKALLAFIGVSCFSYLYISLIAL
jgi:hypothetical protein